MGKPATWIYLIWITDYMITTKQITTKPCGRSRYLTCISDYIPQCIENVITYPCHRCMLLAPTSLYINPICPLLTFSPSSPCSTGPLGLRPWLLQHMAISPMAEGPGPPSLILPLFVIRWYGRPMGPPTHTALSCHDVIKLQDFISFGTNTIHHLKGTFVDESTARQGEGSWDKWRYNFPGLFFK